MLVGRGVQPPCRACRCGISVSDYNHGLASGLGPTPLGAKGFPPLRWVTLLIGRSTGNEAFAAGPLPALPVKAAFHWCRVKLRLQTLRARSFVSHSSGRGLLCSRSWNGVQGSFRESNYHFFLRPPATTLARLRRAFSWAAGLDRRERAGSPPGSTIWRAADGMGVCSSE